MTVIGSNTLNIINAYLSSNMGPSDSFLEDFTDLFNDQKEVLLLGDLNICSINEEKHPILRKLKTLGFKERVKFPSHIAGRQIDHVLQFSPINSSPQVVQVCQFGQYFTDHDLMVVNMSESSNILQVSIQY